LGADALSGAVQSNYGRFLKSIPSGAEEPTITQLPDGSPAGPSQPLAALT
jgi:hypothetical protein